MDPGAAGRHCRPGRCAAGKRSRRQRQDRRADRAGGAADHDPEQPVNADRLLIVTFTNAAAAELRARIGQALLHRSQLQPGNAMLRRQRMLLQRAPICTIDAFCLNLLHKHFQALDIPPDFAPADPGTVQLLRGAALAETLENAYRDPDFCAFADLYGKGRTDKPAGDAILQIYDFLRALPDYDCKLDEFLAPYEQENGFADTCWHDLLLAEAARCAKAARELLTERWPTAMRILTKSWQLLRKKRPHPPGQRHSLRWQKNTRRPVQGWKKPPPSLRRRSSWPLPDSGTRCTTCSPPMCWAWRKRRG